jgi:hypothetical protein
MEINEIVFVNDDDLKETSQKLFYQVVPMYLDFFEAKKWDNTHIIDLYGVIRFKLIWKSIKGLKQKILNTIVSPINDYALIRDDRKLLDSLLEILEHRHIKNISNWYKNKNS